MDIVVGSSTRITGLQWKKSSFLKKEARGGLQIED